MSRMGEYAMEMEQLQQWEHQKELEEMEQWYQEYRNWFEQQDKDTAWIKEQERRND